MPADLRKGEVIGAPDGALVIGGRDTRLIPAVGVKWRQEDGVLELDGGAIEPRNSAGLQVASAPTQPLGLYGAVPVVQPATTGTTTGFTAGAGATVRDDSTFTGGLGTTAYRLSDVVLALKQLGVLAL